MIGIVFVYVEKKFQRVSDNCHSGDGIPLCCTHRSHCAAPALLALCGIPQTTPEME
jgi:hypothetical protein